MSHMFSTKVTALLRRILDDVCADVSIGDSGIKARVAAAARSSSSVFLFELISGFCTAPSC